MPGMRSSGSAGRAWGGGSERRELRNEAAGKEGDFSPNEPACRNICSGLVLHPDSSTREKSLPVHMGLAGACEGTFPSLLLASRGWRGRRDATERGAHTSGFAGSPGAAKSAAGHMARARTRRGPDPSSSEQAGDVGEPSAFAGARPAPFERSPKMDRPRRNHELRASCNAPSSGRRGVALPKPTRFRRYRSQRFLCPPGWGQLSLVCSLLPKGAWTGIPVPTVTAAAGPAVMAGAVLRAPGREQQAASCLRGRAGGGTLGPPPSLTEPQPPA